ncbi:MAG: tripartite tricarboxylate transporter substrate binding protein [Methylobacteriaceae bacterium]|jgi:tripartite-type tricarboxylate transporter receptor subunit TctC|nr:tripartite tricarboxylate transporter substrate binding protein [Methylobacteriaceae bacterium]
MKRLLTALCFAALTCGSASAFPDKDVKIIVPFAPGGGVDVTVRFLSEVAPKYMDGKNLIVENMPGGGAVIGQTAGANARPDGYTLLAYTSSVVSNPMQKQTSFTYKDFALVNMYCFDPEVLVVPKDSPFKTLKDFIEASKTEEISMATPGHSTSHHLAAQLLEQHFGSKFGYIHSSSSAQQLTQLLGGHVQSSMMALGEITSYVADGSIRVLGLMSDANYAGAENYTRFSSLGFNTEWGAFRGVAAPSRTPKDVVKSLSDAFEKMANDPAFKERMDKAGFPMQVYNAEQFSKYVDEVAVIYEKLLKPAK